MATAAAGESEIALALPTLHVNENNYFMYFECVSTTQMKHKYNTVSSS